MCRIWRALTHFTSNGREKGIGHALLLKIKHAIDTYSSRYVIIRPMYINDPDGNEFMNAYVLSLSGQDNKAFGKL